MGNQHNATLWYYLHQRFPDELGIGVGKRFAGDFPDLTVGSAEGSRNGIKISSPSGENGGGGRGSIDRFCRGHEFHRGIIGHATFVFDIGEDPSHYCSPPLAFSNSMSLSMFFSLLPFRISAPLPTAAASTPMSDAPRVGIGTEATCRMPFIPT